MSLTLLDVLAAGPVSVDLMPGFTFVGFTGADGTTLDDLIGTLPPGMSAAFRFDSGDQRYDTYRRNRAPFLSIFTTAQRLDGLFILNEGPTTVALTWEQVAMTPISRSKP